MQQTAYRRKNNIKCYRPRDQLTCMSLASYSVDISIERSITHQNSASRESHRRPYPHKHSLVAMDDSSLIRVSEKMAL
jgi:hypothetical protein